MDSSHGIKMEAVSLLQLLQSIFPFLLEMQATNYQNIQNTRSKQNGHCLQNGPAGRNEKLHAPVRRLAFQHDHHLRVRDDQQPVSGIASVAGRHLVDKVRRAAETEDGIGQLQSKVGALCQLSGAAKALAAVLGDGEIGDSRAWQVCAVRKGASLASASQYHNLEQS